MTAHAAEEMAEDDLSIVDVERSVLTGHVERIERDDPRGTKFVLAGTATEDAIQVGVVGRFSGPDSFLIITVYRISTSRIN
jgi:hypothetical protein